jgi:hypothetical protein
MSYPVITLTKTGTGRSSVHIPDTFEDPFNIGIGCVVSGTGTVTYSVQHTFEDVFSPTFDASTATWFSNSGITDKTANTDGNYAYPVNGISLNITAKTGTPGPTVTVYILQAGAR